MYIHFLSCMSTFSAGTWLGYLLDNEALGSPSSRTIPSEAIPDYVTTSQSPDQWEGAPRSAEQTGRRVRVLKAGRCHPLALGWFAVWLTDNGIKRETEGGWRERRNKARREGERQDAGTILRRVRCYRILLKTLEKGE